MADRADRGSFAWPDRERSAEIERAADLAAERGLERLRERQRRRRALTPPPQDPPPELSFLQPPAPPREPELEPDAEPEEPETEAPAPDLWEAEFDELAEDLITDLRRDLGPADPG